MNKIIFTFILGIIILFFCGCSFYNRSGLEDSTPRLSVIEFEDKKDVNIDNIVLSDSEINEIRNCRIYVEGEDVTLNNYVMINTIDRYAEIPILTVLEHYGATIRNTSDNEISISLNEYEVVLYTDRLDLGIAIMPGGSPSIRKIVNNDLIFDNHSIRTLLHNIGNIDIAIDYENMKVFVTQGTNNTGDGSVS